MEPSAAIAIIETDLRELARSVLSEALGANWLEAVLDRNAISELEARREEERKRREPVAVDEDLLAYTYAYELQTLIEKRWDPFAPALGAKREFSVLMDMVNDYRNAPAHSRELLPHERSLLEGIAGEIRTRVTAYRSSRGPDASFYPIIESIRDSFGHTPESLDPDNLAYVDTGRRLHVGDTVTFECRGWDPQGRDLLWGLRVALLKHGPSASGTEAVLEWVVSEAEVGVNCQADIFMSHAGKYHRHTYADQSK